MNRFTSIVNYFFLGCVFSTFSSLWADSKWTLTWRGEKRPQRRIFSNVSFSVSFKISKKKGTRQPVSF